jgi:cysteine-rich repeat protein
MPHNDRAAPFLLSLALLLAACGDDDAATSATDTATSTSGTSTTDTSTTEPTTDATTSSTTGSGSVGESDSDGVSVTDTDPTTTTADPTTTTTDPTTTTDSTTGTDTDTDTDATTEAPPACGDGQLDPGEECDDANNAPGDGCDADCKKEQPPCDPDGLYQVQGAPIAYTCCQGLVAVNINAFILTGDGATIASSPSNPKTMTGAATTCPDGVFSNSAAIPGGCTETFKVSGEFTDANTWSGTYELDFEGEQCSCFGGMFGTPCVDQLFPVTAKR